MQRGNMTKTLQERKAEALEAYDEALKAWYEADKAMDEADKAWLEARKDYEAILREIEEEGK